MDNDGSGCSGSSVVAKLETLMTLFTARAFFPSRVSNTDNPKLLACMTLSSSLPNTYALRRLGRLDRRFQIFGDPLVWLRTDMTMARCGLSLCENAAV